GGTACPRSRCLLGAAASQRGKRVVAVAWHHGLAVPEPIEAPHDRVERRDKVRPAVCRSPAQTLDVLAIRRRAIEPDTLTFLDPPERRVKEEVTGVAVSAVGCSRAGDLDGFGRGWRHFSQRRLDLRL